MPKPGRYDSGIDGSNGYRKGLFSIKASPHHSSFNQLAHRARAGLARSCHNPVVVLLLLAMMTSLLTLYFSAERSIESEGGLAIFEQRDFSLTPFGLTDAYDTCLLEARSKLGTGLLRAHMLPLSTRYQQDKGTYLVVLSADVGNVKEWVVSTIYCTIDPRAQEISYYKEVYQGQPSLLSRTMSLLGDLMSQ